MVQQQALAPTKDPVSDALASGSLVEWHCGAYQDGGGQLTQAQHDGLEGTRTFEEQALAQLQEGLQVAMQICRK